MTQDKSTMLDYFALGVATYPMTMGEYYSMQEAYAAAQGQQGSDEETIDLD